MRTLTGFTGILALSAALTAAGLAASPAAHAATHDVQITCGSGGTLTLYGDVGDTFVFTMGDGCRDWELNNSLIYNWDEILAQPGLLDYYAAMDPQDQCYYSLARDEGTHYCNAWWVQANAPGATTITTILMDRSLGNTTYPDPVSLEAGGKIAQIDDNIAANSSTWITIIWGGPGDGGSGGGGGRSSASSPVFTLSSSATERGTCWPSVSGRAGTWVQLTASGCTPPSGDTAATLLGWATDPSFPVTRAVNDVAVDEEFGGVRMIFIPVDGYAYLTGDNTLYPVWGSQ